MAEQLPSSDYGSEELRAQLESLSEDPEFIRDMAARMKKANDEGLETWTPLEDILA